ncbi:hypothetical protein QL285_037213 [Trifolium repens]|nr:hypothetical protein QL285_037213 [Trifolium repens]
MMGSLNHNGWAWRIDWSETLSVDEAASEHELLNLIFPFQPHRDMEDRHRWIPSSTRIFSVKCAYIELLNRSVMANLDDIKIHSLELMWKNNVPSKISIFGWRLLLEKLPTRDALFNKGIITSNIEKRCVFCSTHEESISHVFIHCSFSSTVWRKVLSWLGLGLINSNSIRALPFIWRFD